MIEIKYCGMTRPVDAEAAASLGANYVGVIFAGGPRNITDQDARKVFASLPRYAMRVGVFGAIPAAEIGRRAAAVDVDVVQLHGDPTAETVRGVRGVWIGQLWAVLRLSGANVPAHAPELFDLADAVVLDARVDGQLGGNGVALPWQELRERVRPLRGRRARLVLAGGLNPENVRGAVDTLEPDVVDVSSGVETAPGVKDATRMRAFRDAVRRVAGR
jgi:phosphoribosylanthranilate isomerase